MQVKTMPFETPELFCDQIQKNPSDQRENFCFIFKDSKLLVHEDSLLPFQEKNLVFKSSVYMGTFKEYHLYASELLSSADLPFGSICMDMRHLYGKVDDALYALAGKAYQLVLWDRTHQYCGQCGSKTIEMQGERAKECKSCKELFFPKISPVIMALVYREDEILLARGPHFPKGLYSVLAGFVNPGESLEQCVAREVLEEVGLHVENIEYFGSQSWPFPSSLMVAFTCKWKNGKITIDSLEIENAEWFKKDRLPMIPEEISISRFLIDSVLK